jgi:hypothetical protein
MSPHALLIEYMKRRPSIIGRRLRVTLRHQRSLVAGPIAGRRGSPPAGPCPFGGNAEGLRLGGME